MLAISLLVCSFFGVEGGYQLHLSHDHPALGCLGLAMAASGQSGIDGPPSLDTPPPCRERDVVGQGWRVKLVLGDMLVFLLFGSLCIQSAKQLEAAAGA